MGRELTGRKVFAITASAFAIIIAVNVYMAVKAVGTFPGLEVANSYVASQNFDRERNAQEALGWTLTDSYEAGELRLSFRDSAGHPVTLGDIAATVGRTTEAAEDKTPIFVHEGGDYVAPLDLGPGRWMVLLEARAEDGTRFHKRLDISVKD
ncbi:FixH family protein [Albidovulum sediminicola]|uniref:FixH family protein n=1 Tax=Albidovulum sediminicola TaxID=2984331 RepID=A0ABT2YXA2_9RHOB|nr:FixH family protein [Defluviimonas sp. WL0075]MCV2863455.1 FixH family protein [Defluviimonas sp. WL0075]